MKVVIGPYKNWVGPYQIADKLCFWAKPVQGKYGEQKPDWVHDFGTWLAEKKDGSDTTLTKLCNYIDKQRSRQVYVRIDNYDTYSMDHTLAHIIVPMLKQLKATKHGAPNVDDEDVPSPLRSTAPGAIDRCEEPYDLDDNHFHRWDYVLDEMIWAFSQQTDDDAENQFYSDSEVDKTQTFEQQLEKVKIDTVGLDRWQKRKTNGFKLFGKYYEALWD